MLQSAIGKHADRSAIQTPEGVTSYNEFGCLVEEIVLQLQESTQQGEFIAIKAERNHYSIAALVAAIIANRPFIFLDSRDVSTQAKKVDLLGIRLIAEKHPSRERLRLSPFAQVSQESNSIVIDTSRDARKIAYAITTSGSTGEPKCVLVAADPLAHVVADHVEKLSIGPESRTLQFARLTFDGAITEILWTLVAGACLVIRKEEDIAPGYSLRKTLETESITHLKTTPFALAATRPTEKMLLEHVINGGGPCRPSTVKSWSPFTSFHNAYGLTETTICNFLSGALSSNDCELGVPLGEYVGAGGFEVSPLTPKEGSTRGELIITGDAVAIGYLTESGVDYFRNTEDKPEFRTGDIVQFLDDRLVYVERKDRQLKIRGFRIDPGEIENTACQIDGVIESIAIHEKEKDGIEDKLSLYFQGNADTRDVRSHLQQFLEEYKVPSSITSIPSIPYNGNGKVDKDAMSKMRRELASSVEQNSPCSDSNSSNAILGAVRNLTGVMDVVPEDNFFDLGGDSASSLVLVSELRKLGWHEAGVRDVLRAPDLKTLIDKVDSPGD